MTWFDTLAEILRLPLFSLGGQSVTPRQLIVLVLALTATYFASRISRRVLEQRLLRLLQPPARYTLARLSQYLIWVLGIALGLKIVHIDLTGLTIVAGALGIGVGLGLQNVVSNFAAGLVLLFERPISIDDRVTVDNIEGNVVAINFRSTTIVTNDNVTMIVPNSEFINGRVINWSHGDPRVRIRAPVGVAYGSDVELVTRTLLEVATQTDGVLLQPAPDVHFTGFGDSSLNFELLVWTDVPAQHFRLRSRLNYAIDAAFRRNGVQIPFPQRDVHVKTVPAGVQA